MTPVWFADASHDADPAFPFQPVLEDGSGAVLTSCDIWFQTKEECEAFIRTIPSGQAVEG